MKLGVLTSSLSRSAGGLFYSVSAMAAGAARAGTAVKVFGLDDPSFDEDRSQWAVPAEAHRVLGPPALGFAPGLAPALQGWAPDLLHLHGLWMYPSAVAGAWARRAAGPLMVSPHGMLDPWALRHSAWKKALAGWAYERRAWEAAACFHALNGQELDGIRAAGVRKPVAVIPNGVDLPAPTASRANDPGEPRRLLFLGRLHPKKNLHVLLQAWGGLPQAAKRGWRLTLAGWGDEAYQRQLAKAAGADVEILGAHYGPAKDALYRRASAFILPSLSEGLPMAVLEAWSYRLPVLMSRACNLTEGFEAGAALDSGVDHHHVARAIQAFLSLSPLRQADMGKKGRRLVEGQFSWKAVMEKMGRTYAWLLGQADRPSWVVG